MNNDIKILREETITDEDIIMEAKALQNEKKLNSKLFSRPLDAEYIYRNRRKYETLAANLLFMYFSQYEWFVKFERKGSKLYIMNAICPENIPVFSLVGIKDYDQFIGTLLEKTKLMLVEADLDRELELEEYNEKWLKAHEVALQYKKD